MRKEILKEIKEEIMHIKCFNCGVKLHPNNQHIIVSENEYPYCFLCGHPLIRLGIAKLVRREEYLKEKKEVKE